MLSQIKRTVKNRSFSINHDQQAKFLLADDTQYWTQGAFMKLGWIRPKHMTLELRQPVLRILWSIPEVRGLHNRFLTWFMDTSGPARFQDWWFHRRLLSSLYMWREQSLCTLITSFMCKEVQAVWSGPCAPILKAAGANFTLASTLNRAKLHTSTNHRDARGRRGGAAATGFLLSRYSSHWFTRKPKQLSAACCSFCPPPPLSLSLHVRPGTLDRPHL